MELPELKTDLVDILIDALAISGVSVGLIIASWLAFISAIAVELKLGIWASVETIMIFAIIGLPISWISYRILQRDKDMTLFGGIGCLAFAALEIHNMLNLSEEKRGQIATLLPHAILSALTAVFLILVIFRRRASQERA